MKRVILTIFLAFFGMLLFAANANAATVTGTVTVKDQKGAAVANATVWGWSSTSGEYMYETTDSSGNATFEATDGSTWDFGVNGSTTYAGAYDYSQTISSSSLTVTLTVQLTDATITVALTKGGSPYTVASDGYVFVSCYTSDWSSYFSGTVSGSLSSTVLNVNAGTYTCEGYADGFAMSGVSVTVASGKGGTATLVLLEYDSEITINLVNEESGEILSDIESFFVYGYSTTVAGEENSGLYLWGTGENGTATIDVPSDSDFVVGVSIEGFAGTSEEGLSEGDFGYDSDSGGFGENEDYSYSDYGSDEYSEYTDPGYYSEPSTDDGSSEDGSSEDYDYSDDYSGDYGGYGGGDSGYSYSGVRIASEDTQYISSFQMLDISSGESLQMPIGVADATLYVTVKDPDGNGMVAWVEATEGTAPDSSEGEFFSGGIGSGTNSAGEAVLYVKSGITYKVSAYPFNWFGSGENDVLPPPAKAATLESGEEKELVLEGITADHTLTLNVDVEASSAGVGTASIAEHDYTYCYGYAPELGVENFIFLESGSTSGEMPVTSEDDWYVGCMGFDDDTFYYSEDEEFNAEGSSADESEEDITLQTGGTYYEETSVTFDPANQLTYILPDGESTISIPANAVQVDGAAPSGDVTLTVNTAIGLEVEDSNYPIGGSSLFEFELLDVTSGEVITEDLGQSATYTQSYDEDMLEEFGVDEDNIDLDGYSSEQGWQEVSATLDTEENTVTASVPHFSSWGITTNKGLSAVEEGTDETEKTVDLDDDGVTDDDGETQPNKPTKLKVKTKKSTKKSLTWTWKSPTNVEVTKYTLQTRKCKNATKEECQEEADYVKKKQWKTYKKVTTTKKQATKLKKATFYQARVKACNSAGCSKYTDWVRAKTKGKM